MKVHQIGILVTMITLGITGVGTAAMHTYSVFNSSKRVDTEAVTKHALQADIQEYARERDDENEGGGGGNNGGDNPRDDTPPRRNQEPIESTGLYTPQTNLKADLSNPVDVGGYTFYSAPTRNSTSNTYSFDPKKATEITLSLMHDYLPCVTLKKDSVDWAIKDHIWTYEHKRTGTAWQSNGNIKKLGISNIDTSAPAGSIAIDGVKRYIVAMPAGVVNQTIYSSGSWQTQTGGSAADFGNYNGSLNADVVFEKGGSKYYLPVTFGDAKGHTYPGGLCQTSIAASGGMFAYQGSSGSDWTKHEVASKENFPAAYNNLLMGKWGGGTYDASYSMHYLEMCICDSNGLKPFNGFTLKSIIVYK